MSDEIKTEEKEKEKFFSKEYKWKDMLYELFYEIKSEILGCKIEMDEDEYEDNVKSITIPKLVDYLHDSIKILIEKKMYDAKVEQKKIDRKLLANNNNNILALDEKSMYENIILKLESKERYLLTLIFKKDLQINILENKISEYMDMEDEFEEMKTKLKYEDGRFLLNDRKDNEISILRRENSNLKESIKQLEKKITDIENDIINKDKKILEFQDTNRKYKTKIKELQKQNEILKSNYINININNVNGNNNKTGTTYNNNNYKNISNQKEEGSRNRIKNKIALFRKINTKVLSKDKTLNYTKNDLLERSKSDLLNKNKLNDKNKNTRNHINLNNTSLNAYNLICGNSRQLSPSNFNDLPIPAFHKIINFNNNNVNNIQKNILSGLNSSRANSTKKNSKPNKIINYKYFL